MNNCFELIKTVLFLAYYCFVFYYAYKVKKSCKCTKDWKLNYMKYFTLLLSVIGIVDISLQMKNFSNVQSGGGAPPSFWISFFITLIPFVLNYYTIFTHIEDYEKENCQCEKKLRNILYYLTILHVAIVATTLIIQIPKVLERINQEPSSKNKKMLKNAINNILNKSSKSSSKSRSKSSSKSRSKSK